ARWRHRAGAFRARSLPCLPLGRGGLGRAVPSRVQRHPHARVFAGASRRAAARGQGPGCVAARCTCRAACAPGAAACRPPCPYTPAFHRGRTMNDVNKHVNKVAASAGAQWLLDGFSVLRKAPLGLGLLGAIYGAIALVVAILASRSPALMGLQLLMMLVG